MNKIKERLNSITREEYEQVKRYVTTVYCMFVLADLAEGYALEANELLKPMNGMLDGDVLNSIERMKIHSRNLVKFVDKNMNEEMCIQFGDVSDNVREYLESLIQVEK